MRRDPRNAWKSNNKWDIWNRKPRQRSSEEELLTKCCIALGRAEWYQVAACMAIFFLTAVLLVNWMVEYDFGYTGAGTFVP